MCIWVCMPLFWTCLWHQRMPLWPDRNEWGFSCFLADFLKYTWFYDLIKKLFSLSAARENFNIARMDHLRAQSEPCQCCALQLHFTARGWWPRIHLYGEICKTLFFQTHSFPELFNRGFINKNQFGHSIANQIVLHCSISQVLTVQASRI